MAGYTECPMHFLVTSNDYYHQFQERLEDPNEKDNAGNTLLHVAAQSSRDNSRIVQLLIDRGANVEAMTLDGLTPLHLAVVNRKRDAVVALIEAGASTNSKDLMGRTALHLSICKIQSGNLIANIDYDSWILERLLCHPETNLNPVDENGETPLMWSVKERNLGAMMALLEQGANPNIPNKDNQTPLHVALSARNRSIDPIAVLDNIVIRLLVNGAGIYHEDTLRQTPIDILVRNVRDDRKLSFEAFCVHLIALKFHISDSLKRKLDQIPDLLDFLNDCCKEVRLMKKLVIYDNVSLHDFCLDCFQTRVKDPLRQICIPVMEILSTGAFKIYYNLVLHCLSKQNWDGGLEGEFEEPVILDLEPQDSFNLCRCDTIGHSNDGNALLKERLLGFKQILKKEIKHYFWRNNN